MAKLISWLKNKGLLTLLLFVSIIGFVFRNLILNISHAFIDWGDTTFIAWQIFITRNKILQLNFSEILHTNSHYPYKYSLFFTDTFIGQAIMSVPLFFIKNPILLHNIIYLFTILLNYIFAYLLFKKIFKSKNSGVIASILINNSAYFFDQIIHLQTLSYWPIFIMIYFLLELLEKKRLSGKVKSAIFAGIFLSVQFYMAVYLGIFATFILAIFYFTLLVFYLLSAKNRWVNLFEAIFTGFVTGIVFAVITYPFLIKFYLLFGKIYHQVRDINEILMNSTHFTDYFFFLPKTLFSSLGFIKRYNLFNNHHAAEMIFFPGFILLGGAFLGFFVKKIKLQKKNMLSISYQIGFLDIFFLILALIGFIFSLGPRLNGNGKYLEIPLPYLIFISKISVLNSIRLTHRWAFLLIIALVYFATKFYRHLPKVLIIFIAVIFLFESVQFNIPATAKPYLDKGHVYIKNNPTKHNTLLEYPFLNLEKEVPIDYETRILLASTFHNYKLFNGYTGLFLNDPGVLRIMMERTFPNNSINASLNSLGIDYVKVNKLYVEPATINKIRRFYKSQISYEDTNSIIILLKNTPSQNPSSVTSVLIKKSDAIAYGLDKRFFLNIDYKNKSKHTVANIDQEMILIDLVFYKNNRVTRHKQLFDTYPLVNSGKTTFGRTISFYEDIDFDKVGVIIKNQNQTILDKGFFFP